MGWPGRLCFHAAKQPSLRKVVIETEFGYDDLVVSMPLSSLHFGKKRKEGYTMYWVGLVSMPLSSLHFGKTAIALALLLWQPVFPCR